VNKRQRKAHEKRTASGYQVAQDKRSMAYVDRLSKAAQELADERVRRQYSIVG